MISPTKLELMLGHKGNVPIDDVNRVSIIGKIVHIFNMSEDDVDHSEGYIVTVKTYEGNGRFYFPKLICFTHNCKIIEEAKVGDKIATVAMVQTRLKKNAKLKGDSEGIVCLDIAILK